MYVYIYIYTYQRPSIFPTLRRLTKARCSYNKRRYAWSFPVTACAFLVIRVRMSTSNLSTRKTSTEESSALYDFHIGNVEY